MRAQAAGYAVDNAVILAAGEASRFAPLSFEKPKPMFEVRGEVLIDRMIAQLQEAGVRQIYVVVGYMAEAFDYLKDVDGVEVVFNPDYADMNNFASLYAVADKLANSYNLFGGSVLHRKCFCRAGECTLLFGGLLN